MKYKEVFMLSGARLPTGKFQGSLHTSPAPDLGAHVSRAALVVARMPPGVGLVLGEVLKVVGVQCRGAPEPVGVDHDVAVDVVADVGPRVVQFGIPIALGSAGSLDLLDVAGGVRVELAAAIHLVDHAGA